MNDEPIFTSTGQALSVSFLIMSVEARQKNAFRLVLMRIIESVEEPSARLRAWYKELQGEPGTVNFAGLDPYEVRGQCAMVAREVQDHLPAPERDVVWRSTDSKKRRAREYSASLATSGRSSPLLTRLPCALVYGYFDSNLRKPKDEKKNIGGLSYQEISEERGIHVKTLKRANSIIAGTSNILMEMAHERLTPMFLRDGLIRM
ncbi:hypothetical protein ACFQUU_06145 [Herbaspirillum sp. GCM10030257]|uniref:hypothetical protein n=1 Tax=Herbaspirillum sp. GCM10030257 TaxID=3273393 RepID=UPI0036191256